MDRACYLAQQHSVARATRSCRWTGRPSSRTRHHPPRRPSLYLLPSNASVPATVAAAVEADKKRPYPPPASSPTQSGPQGIRFDFNHGARVVLPSRTEGKWRIRLRDLDTGNILFQSENQGAFVSSAKRFFVRFGVEVWELDAAGAADLGAVARLRRARPRHPDPVPDRHAGRHPGLVSLRPAVRRGAWLPADLRDVRPDHPAAARRLSGDPLRHARGTGRAEARGDGLRHLLPGPVLRRRGERVPADRFPPCRAASHGGLHPGRRSGGGSAAPGAAGRRAADRRAVCLHRRAELDAEQELDEPGWLARGDRVPEGQRLPGDLHRPEAGARHRHRLEPHPARGGGPDRRPSAGGAGALAAPCQGVRRTEQRTVVARLGGGRAGGADQRLHPSDQRVHHAVPGDQLARLQQLLERRAAPVRPQGLPVVPAPCRHAAPVRVHAADHRRRR